MAYCLSARKLRLLVIGNLKLEIQKRNVLSGSSFGPRNKSSEFREIFPKIFCVVQPKRVGQFVLVSARLFRNVNRFRGGSFI